MSPLPKDVSSLAQREGLNGYCRLGMHDQPRVVHEYWCLLEEGWKNIHIPLGHLQGLTRAQRLHQGSEDVVADMLLL